MKKNIGLLTIVATLLAPLTWGQAATYKKLPKAAISKATASKTVIPKATVAKAQKVALVNTSQHRFIKPSHVNEEIKFSGSAEISRSTSLYDLKNGSKYDGMDYLVSLAYKLPTGSVSTRLSYSQDLNDQTGENSSINDSNLTYSHKSDTLLKDSNSAVISWSPSFTAIVPLSERSQKVEQLQTALIGSVSLKVLAGDYTSLSGTGLSLSISAGQNFHRFETDVNGTTLNKNSSNQSLAAFYSLGDFTFTVSFANKIRWPYAGDVRQSFELSEDITYSFLKVWSVSLGHTNAGSALKPNGYDSNISLIDDDNSLIYLGLAYGF